MKQKPITLYHRLLKKLGLSCNQYCLADTIRVLATDPTAPVAGWCTLSRGRLGDRLNLSRQSVVELIKKLIEAGLIEEDEWKHLRPTAYFTQLVVDEEIQAGDTPVHLNSSASMRRHAQQAVSDFFRRHGGALSSLSDDE